MSIDKDKIYFAKIRPTAIIPTKKEEDAGYDIYADFDEDFFVIEAGQSRPIPTGIAIAFSSKYYAQIEERSSMAKIGIKKSGGVFDSGYRGEYFIVTYNTNTRPFVIHSKPIEQVPDKIDFNGKIYKKDEVILYPKTKAICQVVMQIVPSLQEEELCYEELLKIPSSRGTGAFGHSNK